MNEFTPAVGFKRWVATFIDGLVTLVPFYILSLLFSQDQMNNSLAIAWLVTYVAYSVGMILYRRQTLGQIIFRYHTVDRESYRNPSAGKLIARELIFLTIFTGLGLIIFAIFGYYWDKLSGVITVQK